MDEQMKKTKILLIFGLCIVLVQSILGFTVLFVGLTYSELDRDAAEEMLEALKISNVNLYEKITKTMEAEYVKQFQEAYTTRMKPNFIIFGLLYIVLAVGAAIPLVSIFYDQWRELKAAPSEVSEEEGETEKEGETEET